MMQWLENRVVVGGSVGLGLAGLAGYVLDVAVVQTCDPAGAREFFNSTFLQTCDPTGVLMGQMGLCGAMYGNVAWTTESVSYGTWTWKEN